METNGEKLCLTHGIFYHGENCPICMSEQPVQPSFRISVSKADYEKEKERLGEKGYGSYHKPFDWISHANKYCTVAETEDEMTFSISITKLFEEGVIESDEIHEIISKLMNEIIKQNVNKDISMSSHYINQLVQSVNDLWQASLVVTINKDNLMLRSKNPLLKNIHLSAWSNQPVFYSEDKTYSFSLEKPMNWETDVNLLVEKNFKVEITPEVTTTLNQLAETAKTKYFTVLIKPYEDGVQIFLYKHIDQEYKDRLEKGCSIKYWKSKKRGIYEDLKFIERKSALDTDETIVYVAKYFTFPVIFNLFKKDGFNVIVDETLFKQYAKLDCEIHKNFELYDVQKPAVTNWYNNNKVGTIVIPTGGGKTLVALDILSQVKEWTLILVPTIEIKNQWYEFLTGYSVVTGEKVTGPNLGIPKDKVGEFFGSKKEVKPITIALFQSAHKYVGEEDNDEEEEDVSEEEEAELEKWGEEFGKLSENFGLFISDEGHHLAAPLWKKTAIYLKSLKRVSLTATPERYDGNEPLLFFTMGDPIYKVSYAELATKQIVSPIKYERCIVPLTKEEVEILEMIASIKGKRWWSSTQLSEAREKLQTLYLSLPYVELRKEKFMAKVEKAKLKGKEVESDFMVKKMQVRIIHFFARKKFEKLLEIIKKHKNDKILIFNEYVIGTKLVSAYLEQNGINCEILTGSTKRVDREEIFDTFKSSNSSIIVTTTVLDEGINVPDCNVIIVFNGRKRRRQMVQRIGRGCRYRKYKIEYAYEIVASGEEEVEEEVTQELKVGNTVYIIGGIKGMIGEECIVEQIPNYANVVHVKGKKTNEVYDKQLSNLSMTVGGKPVSVVKTKTPSYYHEQWKYIYENYLVYEFNISEERDPTEVIGDHTALINNVLTEMTTAKKCKIEACSEKVLKEGNIFCSAHLAAYTNIQFIVKQLGIKDIKMIESVAKTDPYMYDIYQEAVKTQEQKANGSVKSEK